MKMHVPLALSLLLLSTASSAEELQLLAAPSTTQPSNAAAVPDRIDLPSSVPLLTPRDQAALRGEITSRAPTHLSDVIDQVMKPGNTTTERDDVLSALRSITVDSPSDFDALGNVFDVQDQERPWSTTTSIRLQAKTDTGVGHWTPFMSVAREVAEARDAQRMGVGGGMAYYLTPNESFRTELLYFGNRADSTDAFERETRLSLQYQVQF